ncbi:MAG: DAK2 domain-containing protein [Lachnospiraceae bacterium]|nr:DAK2 domain-containing protein [Lachnospiraceae bacterium]
MLKKAFLSGAALLTNKKEYINELNVFPVPDGDTGTNMTMTISSARKEVLGMQDPTIESLAKAVSSGSLRGARGNSGVILSQIFRGFGKALKGCEEIDIETFVNAIKNASDTAHKAVMKPKEGTILTVIQSGAVKAQSLYEEGLESDDILEFIKIVVADMEVSLENTPNLLPVLKEAGVVDSGGEGLMTFARGAISALEGKEITSDEGDFSPAPPVGVRSTGIETENIKFGYCTEFIIMVEPDEFTKVAKEPEVIEKELKKYLNNLGDCVVVVADDDIVKVHVHTNAPGLAIQKALTYGQLTSMKIDNMREEHNEKVIKEAEKIARGEKELPRNEGKPVTKADEEPKKSEPKSKNGFVTISSGEGLSDLFKDLGVDVVVEGGQTMNPSTEDILEAVEKVNAENVFIFPNNSNIIMAANQAATLTDDKNVVVIPTVNIPQGINAKLNFIDEMSPEENKETMLESIKNVSCGQVTYAVRDTSIDGFDITKGDFMGMNDKKLVAVEKDIDTATEKMIDKMVNDDTELVSIYYGEDVTEDDANALATKVEEKYPDIETETNFGGQAVYYYIVSAE